MRFIKMAAAFLPLLLAACQQGQVVPATCEGIATGVDVIVANEAKVSDKSLKTVDYVVSSVYEVCSADRQPALDEAGKKVLNGAAKQLSLVLTREGLTYDAK